MVAAFIEKSSKEGRRDSGVETTRRGSFFTIGEVGAAEEEGEEDISIEREGDLAAVFMLFLPETGEEWVEKESFLLMYKSEDS